MEVKQLVNHSWLHLVVIGFLDLEKELLEWVPFSLRFSRRFIVFSKSEQKALNDLKTLMWIEVNL